MPKRLAVLLLSAIGLAQAWQQPGGQLKKPLIYEIGETVHINATGSRPLLQAIEALQQKYGWAISYEDPQYPPDAPGTANAPSPPNRRHAYFADRQDGGFSVQFSRGPNGKPEEASVLRTVIEAYNQSNGTAEFKLEESAGSFAVIGVGVRGANNQIEEQQPVLSLPISLPSQQRTVTDTISLICRGASEAGKVSVSLAVDPGQLATLKTVVGGDSEAARTLLTRTLESAGNGLYWQLLYDVSGKGFLLTVRSQ